MNIKEIIELIEYFTLDEDVSKIALFLNKNNEIGIIVEREFNGCFINLEAYNLNGENTAYLDITAKFDNEKRLFLGAIYCYEKYRNLGIASYLNTLLNYLLKDYIGYIITGFYMPRQMSTDMNNKISDEQLDIQARRFYQRNGYVIISQEEFLRNPELYNMLSKEIDFPLDETTSNIKIFKKVKSENYDYINLGNILLHKSLLNNHELINELKNKKSLKLTAKDNRKY